MENQTNEVAIRQSWRPVTSHPWQDTPAYKAITAMMPKEATSQDIERFLFYCAAFRLDPLRKDAWLVPVGGNKLQEIVNYQHLISKAKQQGILTDIATTAVTVKGPQKEPLRVLESPALFDPDEHTLISISVAAVRPDGSRSEPATRFMSEFRGDRYARYKSNTAGYQMLWKSAVRSLIGQLAGNELVGSAVLPEEFEAMQSIEAEYTVVTEQPNSNPEGTPKKNQKEVQTNEPTPIVDAIVERALKILFGWGLPDDPAHIDTMYAGVNGWIEKYDGFDETNEEHLEELLLFCLYTVGQDFHDLIGLDTNPAEFRARQKKPRGST